MSIPARSAIVRSRLNSTPSQKFHNSNAPRAANIQEPALVAAAGTPPSVRIAHASTVPEYEMAGQLISEYVAWCRARYRRRAWMVDRYFGEDALRQEVADIASAYAAPHGAFLIAKVHGQAAGCVALRGLGGGAAEVKRLYVRPEFQGFGIGRSLLITLIALARRKQVTSLLLETGDLLSEAQALYRMLGFKPVANYSDAPSDAQEHLIAMALDLQR